MIRPASVAAPTRHLSHRSRLALVATALLASASLLLSGCGVSNDLTGHAEPTQGVAMKGQIHGGQQPVAGSTVTLYAAGSTGYGSASQILTTTVSDSNGNFSITGQYTCPGTPNDLVYIVAQGGNPGGGINLNLSMMAGLGSCSNLKANAATTVINIDEVTTIASVYALQQFMTGVASVGTSSGNYQGLASAFATINNLVDTSYGVARTVTPAYAASNVPYLNSSTVPQSRINTLADILAACINSTGVGTGTTPCSSLFAAATPPAGVQPIDTIQAALNIAQHPGTNVATLFNIAASNAPFQPVLATAPVDWTLAVSYTGAGLGSVAAVNNSTIQEQTMAIDANGAIWITGFSSSGQGGTNASGMVTGFTNLGEPITPSSTVSTATPPVVTYGGFGVANNSAVYLPGSLAVDPSNNLWIYANSRLLELSTTPGVEQSNTINLPLANLIFDGNGILWGTDPPLIAKYNGSNTLTQYSPVSGIGAGALTRMVFDSNNNLWATYSAAKNSLVMINSTTGAKVTTYTTAYASGSPLVAGASGAVYACNATSTGFQVYNASNATTFTNSFAPTGRCGGKLVLDGLSNIWTINSINSAVALEEISSSGTAVSPVSTGYTGTSSGEALTITSTNNGLAVDGSGNIWAMQNQADATHGNALVEFIGLAAPVLTPASLQLQYGELGARP